MDIGYMRKPHIRYYGGWWMVMEGGRNDGMPSCSGYYLDQVAGYAKHLWDVQLERNAEHERKRAARAK